jgi:hypothetical protein
MADNLVISLLTKPAQYDISAHTTALHTVEMWCDELGLSVNPDKTGLVAITRRRKLAGLFEPRLYGTTLCRPMSVK